MQVTDSKVRATCKGVCKTPTTPPRGAIQGAEEEAVTPSVIPADLEPVREAVGPRSILSGPNWRPRFSSVEWAEADTHRDTAKEHCEQS